MSRMRALADKGGVVGIFNISEWLTRADTATLDAVLDHIQHVVQIAGMDHIGFGSDHSMEALDNLEELLRYSQATAPGRDRRRVFGNGAATRRDPGVEHPHADAGPGRCPREARLYGFANREVAGGELPARVS